MPQCQRCKINGQRCSRQSEGRSQYCWQHKDIPRQKQKGGYWALVQPVEEEDDIDLINEAMEFHDCAILNRVHDPSIIDDYEIIEALLQYPDPCFRRWAYNQIPFAGEMVGAYLYLDKQSEMLWNDLKTYVNSLSPGERREKVIDGITETLYDRVINPTFLEIIRPELEAWGIDVDESQRVSREIIRPR